MAEAARQLYCCKDPYIEGPSNSFRIHSTQDTAEVFDPAIEYAENKAAIFWGLREVDFFSPQEVNLPDQLSYLRRALGRLSLLNLDEYEDEREWVNLKKRSQLSGVQQIPNRNLRIPIGTLSQVTSTNTPVTYGEAYDNPDIKYNLLGQMSYHGDPKIAVIKAFDDWRLRYRKGEIKMQQKTEKNTLDLDSAKTRQGFEAFRLFLFGAGGKSFLASLKAVTIDYLLEDTGDNPKPKSFQGHAAV